MRWLVAKPGEWRAVTVRALSEGSGGRVSRRAAHGDDLAKISPKTASDELEDETASKQKARRQPNERCGGGRDQVQRAKLTHRFGWQPK